MANRTDTAPEANKKPRLNSLKAVEFSEHFDLDLRHPITDEPFELNNGETQKIRLLNPDHELLQRLASKWRNEALRGKKVTAELEETRWTDYLVTATIDWEIQLDPETGPIAYSEKTARTLYTDPDLRWLRRQLTKALGDDGNFAVLGESARS